MKKFLLLATFVFFTARYAHAASKQGATFTCRSGLSLPVISFYLEVPSSNLPGASSYVSVTTDLDQFQALLVDALSGRLDDTCEIQLTGKEAASSLSLQFLDVAVSLVSITADKGKQYVTATLNFARIESLAGGGTIPAKTAPALSPAQQNKAVTEFLARTPKPSAN